MKNYRVHFWLGFTNSMVQFEFAHCTKHDTESAFECAITEFADALNLRFAYKEEIK